MISFPALPPRALALFLVALACYVVLTPVVAVETDEGQVEAMMQASQQAGFGWTVEALRNACESRYAGVESCNESGFVTSIEVNGAFTAVAPAAFTDLVALKSLTLAYNLNGTLPSSWSSLAQLETLTLGNEGSSLLTGALPESWSAMTNLKTLQVFFADSPPTPIATSPPSWLGAVELVDITSAYWPDSALPASIGSSTTLKKLKLFRCQFKGDFPSGLITNTHIEFLELESASSSFGTGFTFPSDLSGMTNLKWFHLEGSSFTGSFPTAYPPNLESLILMSMHQITGTIPQSIVDHPTLTNFVGHEMKGIFGPLPIPSNPTTSILTRYAVSGMGITGTIPSSLLKLSAFVTLGDLPKLTGAFPTVGPASASSCRTRSIYVGDLNLKNTPLPIGLLENCATMSRATFINSGFTGQLPDFTAAVQLYSLVLDSNPFGGTIPIIKFASTEATFSCNNCSLTGVVPPFYLNTTAFSDREFAGNKLDLCSNRAAIVESGFANQSSNCGLVDQTPRECGCPEIWPTECFVSRPMAPDCNNLPPDTLAPSSSPVPTAPSAPAPPANLLPNAASSPSIPSIALIATLLVTFMTFL